MEMEEVGNRIEGWSAAIGFSRFFNNILCVSKKKIYVFRLCSKRKIPNNKTHPITPKALLFFFYFFFFVRRSVRKAKTRMHKTLEFFFFSNCQIVQPSNSKMPPHAQSQLFLKTPNSLVPRACVALEKSKKKSF